MFCNRSERVHMCLYVGTYLCFVFQVLLCFSRDTSVLEHFTYNSATPPKSSIHSNAFTYLSLLPRLKYLPCLFQSVPLFFVGKSGSEQFSVVYPPNGEKAAFTVHVSTWQHVLACTV